MIEDEAPRTWPEAVANFEKKLDAASSDLAAHLRDKTQPPPNVQVRVRQLAVDCVASSATLRAEHEAAVRANAEAHPGSRVLLRVATGGSGMTSSGSDRLVVAYKSVFFYVRAYQDELYRLLLATLPGAKAGRGSMNAAVSNPENPVALRLTEEVPGYLEWFAKWRHWRDDIKAGRSFGVVGYGDDLGLVRNRVHAPGAFHVSFHESEVVTLVHIAQALDYSARLTQLSCTR